jgi:hypothetical protein
VTPAGRDAEHPADAGVLTAWSAYRKAKKVAKLADRAEPVADRALQLAEDGVEDAAAVTALTSLAGRDRDLLIAAGQSLGDEPEDLVGHRAWRLLRAAASGTPVEPITGEQRERQSALGRLAGLPRDEAFAELADREPQLGRLRDAVRDRAPELFEVPESEWPPTVATPEALESSRLASRLQQHMEQVFTSELWASKAVAERLQQRVSDLVGPDSPASNFILRSGTARAIALEHLWRLKGGYPFEGSNPFDEE